MEHGYLSTTYRSTYVYYMRGHEIAVTYVVRHAMTSGKFSTSTILRNGPRILKACETLRNELSEKVQ